MKQKAEKALHLSQKGRRGAFLLWGETLMGWIIVRDYRSLSLSRTVCALSEVSAGP